MLMYKQLIRPLMLYACPAWMQISSNQMERLRRMERWKVYEYLQKSDNKIFCK